MVAACHDFDVPCSQKANRSEQNAPVARLQDHGLEGSGKSSQVVHLLQSSCN